MFLKKSTPWSPPSFSWLEPGTSPDIPPLVGGRGTPVHTDRSFLLPGSHQLFILSWSMAEDIPACLSYRPPLMGGSLEKCSEFVLVCFSACVLCRTQVNTSTHLPAHDTNDFSRGKVSLCRFGCPASPLKLSASPAQRRKELKLPWGGKDPIKHTGSRQLRTLTPRAKATARKWFGLAYRKGGI